MNSDNAYLYLKYNIEFYLKIACPTNAEDAISPAYLPEVKDITIDFRSMNFSLMKNWVGLI